MSEKNEIEEAEEKLRAALQPLVIFWEEQLQPALAEFSRLISEYLIPVFEQLTGFIKIDKRSRTCPLCHYKEAQAIKVFDEEIAILCPFCGLIDERIPIEKEPQNDEEKE